MAGKAFEVEITLVSQKRRCHRGHQVGDRWRVGRTTPAGLCLGAFASLLPYLTALRFGGDFPWERNAGEGTFCCPDPEVLNVFHLRRLAGSKESPRADE